MIYIHFSLIIKFLFNLIILIILLISSRNIKLLKSYQKLYLVLTIIIWFLIVIKYLLKFSALIIVNIKKKKFEFKEKIKIALKLAWAVTNIPAYIIMIIAFVYDCCEIIRGNVADITYEIIFSSICILFVCFTINDYYQFEIFVNLISEIVVIIKKIEEEKEKSEIKINETEFEFDLKALPSNLLKSSNNNININKEKIL
jgi:hypothetical protein